MDTSKLNFSSLKEKITSKLKESVKPAEKKVAAPKPSKKSENQDPRNDNKKKSTSDSGKKKAGSPSKAAGSNIKKPSFDKKSHEDRKSGTNNKRSKIERTASNGNADGVESPASILRREALALGATEEDLKLLDGVSEGEESEQEFVASKETLDKEFGDDLGKFMKDIGLGNGSAIVIDDDADEVESEIPDLVEHSEEDQESSQEESEETPATAESESDQFEENEDQEQEELEDLEESKVEEKQLDFSKTAEAKKGRLESVASVTTDRLAVEARIDWYNVKLDVPAPEKLTPQQVSRLFELGKEALDEDNKVYYDEFSKSSSQKKFLSEILTNGTLNDKISALTLLIQEAPLHNIKAFDNLLGMCSKKSRTAALQSINALKDLFVNGLLPDRKLISFTKQPKLSNALNKKQLALLYYEDYLKKSYFKFVGILEVLSHDPIIHVRMNVVNHLFELLKAKPEQEVNLLKLGVNKLGDIDNKVSAKASYQILQLEQQHPMMKKIVIDAVTDVIFKKNNEYHATYYSVLALNQTILTRKEDDVANSLIKTYFTLFEKVLIESDGKNISELKSSEYNKSRTKRNSKKGKKGGKSVKNDKSELEIIEEKNSKLFSAILTGLNRAFPFCSLSNEVFGKHLDTLFKITHSTNFNTSVQALVLIHHITVSQKLNPDRFYRTLYESLLDQRLLTSSKQGIYLNLLFKALKEDKDSSRVASFVKRICQICLNWLNIGTISGMIYLLINLEKTTPSLRNWIITTPSDVIEDDDDTLKNLPQYDPRQRDPRFTNAESSSLWELNQFMDHYHPTVSLYAESLLNQKEDVNKPDLGLYTLSHFLDKFVYKNAKQRSTTKGTSIMQPLAGAQTGSLLVRTTGDSDVPVNTRDWLSTKIEEIRPDDMFFYKYFSSKQDKIARSKFDKEVNKQAEGEDDEEQGSDLDDDQVWSALVKSNPEVEGVDESDFDDFDDELSDFDEADFSDDNEEDSAQEIEGLDDDLIGDSESEVEDAVLKEAEDEGEPVDDESEEVEVAEESEPELDSASNSDSDGIELFKGDAEDEYDSEEVELQAIGDSSDEEIEIEKKSRSKKRKQVEQGTADTNSKKSKKNKFKDLPTFADADEYAKYLESDDEEF